MNRQINITNYESFFIDYLDGNLSSEEVSMLEIFLKDNPQLQNELEGLEKVQLFTNDIEFLHRDDLKQIDLALPVNEDNFNYFCIASWEGDLNEEQEKQLNDYLIENPAKKSESNLYGKVILQPSLEIFDNKAILKKNFFIINKKEVLAAFAVAASIALLFVLVNFPGFRKEGELAIDTYPYVQSEKITDEKADTTEVEAVKSQLSPESSPLMKAKNPALNSKTNLRFKVTIPIAKTGDSDYDIQSSGTFDAAKVLAKIDLDLLNKSIAYFDTPVRNDRIGSVSIKPTESQANLRELIASEKLQDYALQKFSSFVFGNTSPKDVSLWTIASAGINRIGELTGSEVKLERSVDPEGKMDGITFNSPVLSFSAPLK